MEEFLIPGVVLMENAGAGAARVLEEILDKDSHILETTYYRYYESDSDIGYTHGLEYVFSGPSFAPWRRFEGKVPSACCTGFTAARIVFKTPT